MMRYSTHVFISLFLLMCLVGVCDSQNYKSDVSCEEFYRSSRHQRSSLDSRQSQRGKRQADPLVEYSNKFSTVARIANGISLLAGLNDGRIPMDAIIEELANFGSAKVSEVLGIQKNKIDAVLQDLAAAHGKLIQSNDVKKLEKQTLALGRIRQEYKKISNFSSFKAPPNYFNEVETLKSDPTDFKVFKTMDDMIVSALEDIETLRNDSLVDYTKTWAIFKSLEGKLQRIPTSIASIQSVGLKIDSLKEIRNKEALKPLAIANQLMSIWRATAYVKDTGSDDLTSLLKITSTLSDSFKRIGVDIVALNKLVSSRDRETFKQRRFTSAFPGSAADLKKLINDVLDASVRQALGSDANIARLSDTMNPLVIISEKLELLKAKLKPLSSAGTVRSVSLAVRFQQSIAVSPFQTSSAPAIFSALGACNVPSVPNTDEAAKLAEDAKKLAATLENMKVSSNLLSSLSNVPDAMTTVMNKISKLSQTANQPEVKTVLNDYQSEPDTLQKFIDYLINLLLILRKVLDDDVKMIAQEIINNKNELAKFQGDSQVKAVFDGFACVTSLADPVEDVVNAIKTTQIIRNFQPGDISNITSAVNIVSQVFVNIKDLQTTPASMKKTQTEDMKRIVEMKDSQKTSDTLGSAASSIHFMNSLQQMKPKMSALQKDGGVTFHVELAKLADASQKREIEQKWGDHTTFLASLAKTLQEIDGFKLKIPANKDLRQLGSPLAEAKRVSDVKANIPDKSDAIAALISVSTDQVAQKSLSETKDQLDDLAALDLQFSSHHSAYPMVPDSLKALFDFLSGSLSGPSAGANSSNKNDLDEGGNVWVFLIILFIFLICIIILAAVCIYRWNQIRWSSWKNVSAVINTLFCNDTSTHVNHHRTVINTMKMESVPQNKVDQKFNKYSRYTEHGITEEQRVKMKGDGWYHASWIKVPKSKFFADTRFIAAQAPMDDSRAPIKLDNRHFFWQLICEQKPEYIVKLCQDYENKREKCSPYFPKLGERAVYGNYSVDTKTELTKETGVIERTLVVTCNGKKHSLTHIQYKNWPDHGAPKDPRAICNILNRVTKSSKPIFVHCSAGVGRSMTFIGIYIAAIKLGREPSDFKLTGVCAAIRDHRCDAITTIEQTYLVQVGAVMIVCDRYGGQGTELSAKFQKEYKTRNPEMEKYHKHEKKRGM